MISAARLIRHLNCDVELNSYDDGTLTLECNTCGKILMSIPINQSDIKPEEEPMLEFDGTNADDVEVCGATFVQEPSCQPVARIPQIEEVPDVVDI